MTEPGFGGAGRPPDLLFCRRCRASVARREILSGEARLLEDRAFCPACAPGALALRRSLRWAAAAGGAALLAASLWIALESRERAAGAARRSGEAVASLEEFSRRAGVDGESIAALEGEARGLAEATVRLARGLRDLREETARGREVTEDHIDGVERSLATVLDTLEGIRKELLEMSGNPRLTEAEEREQLRRLGEPNTGVRFEALWVLLRGSGPAAREAAVRGLSDPEDSVRYQAAVLARVLGVRSAVPALVDCLSFPSAAVRSAAIDALVALEGTDLGFDPLDPSEQSRSEAVHRWEERLRSR